MYPSNRDTVNTRGMLASCLQQGLDTNGCPIAQGNLFWVGASTELQTVAPWASASICTISNLSDRLSLTQYMVVFKFIWQ